MNDLRWWRVSVAGITPEVTDERGDRILQWHLDVEARDEQGALEAFCEYVGRPMFLCADGRRHLAPAGRPKPAVTITPIPATLFDARTGKTLFRQIGFTPRPALATATVTAPARADEN
jgi:hypothetical protein